MMLEIPEVLSKPQVDQFRKKLDQAEWIDGKVTAGHQSAKAKYNMQLPEEHPVAQELGTLIINALERNSLFMSTALPLKVFRAIFSSQFQITESENWTPSRS